MYIRTAQKVRRSLSGLGWTGGFTLPGSTIRYSTEKCTGSAANPMTNGDTICGMDSEAAYLNRIGCVAVGFRGEHNCSTDDNNAGALYCCPEGVLAAARVGGAQAPGGPIVGGISMTQIAGLAGVAAVIGILGYLLTRKQSELPELTPEQEQWADESGAAFGRDLRGYGRKYGIED